MTPHGPVHTRGHSFRARAEARQRAYRAEVLGVGWDTHGHWLDAEAVAAGANFVSPVARQAALRRQVAGKGVTERTFKNMLSSQAMCFNLFAPLAEDLGLATRALTPLLPGLLRVDAMHIEHTPAPDIFGDQSGLSGVDCDLLVEATFADGPVVLIVETKLVEPGFSACGFRRSGKTGRACPTDVAVRDDPSACAYEGGRGYAYWRRAREHATLAPLPEVGCPFGGPLWQLWVNHTLAHVEAARRGAGRARLLVCAPSANRALLRGGEVLSAFARVLREPETVGLLDLDAVIGAIGAAAGAETSWVVGLRGRYGGIG